MRRCKTNIKFPFAYLVNYLLALLPSAFAADLYKDSSFSSQQLPSAFKGWTLDFTPYSWLPWLSGDLTVKGRIVDVNVDPKDILQALDWSTLPAWMSYAEVCKGPLFL